MNIKKSHNYSDEVFKEKLRPIKFPEQYLFMFINIPPSLSNSHIYLHTDGYGCSFVAKLS